MDTTFFFKGLVIGFGMAMPLGPIGVMCIRKTLTEGRLRGLNIGFGAASADLIYSSIAAFGITYITNFIQTERIWIRLIGGALLLFLGARAFFTEPHDPKKKISNSSLIRSYLSTVFLTLTNPLTIFAFIAVFAGLGIGSNHDDFSATALVIGVFTGSFLWFILLSQTVTLFRKRLNSDGVNWVNKIAGALIFVSGIIAVISIM